MGYSKNALAKSSAGFSIPSKSAEALTRSAFFSPVFYGGLYRGSSERRSLAGYANSVQSATLLLILNINTNANGGSYHFPQVGEMAWSAALLLISNANGGSSLNLSEATTMTNLYDISIETKINDDEAGALSDVLLKLLRYSSTHFAFTFTDEDNFQAVHALAGIRKLSLAIEQIMEGRIEE